MKYDFFYQQSNLRMTGNSLIPILMIDGQKRACPPFTPTPPLQQLIKAQGSLWYWQEVQTM